MIIRDQQRSKVYKWEQTTFGSAHHTEELSLKECERIARRVQAAYVLSHRRLRVCDGRGFRRAVAYPDSIYLPKWARNRVVLLHELAHWMLKQVGTCDSHGPIFVRTFLELLDWFGIMPMNELRSTAVAHRIKRAAAGKTIKRKRGARAPKVNLLPVPITEKEAA